MNPPANPHHAAAPPIEIAVINESTVVSDAEVQSAVQALQVQVSRDFAPIWGVDAKLTVLRSGEPLPAAAWWLAILDNTDQAGALGYHDLTTQGLPLGKVFAATDMQYGRQWTVTASHEVLEVLGDPHINLAAVVEPGRAGAVMTMYAYEVCDACEADEFGYKIDGVLLSDFVYPAWFEPFWPPGGTQFDFRNRITAPFELLPGGYISVYDVGSGQGWSQLTADKTPLKYAMRPHIGSRRERRRTPRRQWLASRVFPKSERATMRLPSVTFTGPG